MRKAFIEVVNPEDAEGALKRAYKRIGGERGAIAHVHQSQSLNPKAMMAHLDLYMSIMYSDSPLSRIQRELIATVVSYFNNCSYCILHHHEALVHNWNEAPKPEVLANGDGLSEEDKKLVEFCEKLTLNPGGTNETDYRILKSHGFNDRAILDISLIIGYFNFVNRLVMGVGVEVEPSEDRDYKY